MLIKAVNNYYLMNSINHYYFCSCCSFMNFSYTSFCLFCSFFSLFLCSGFSSLPLASWVGNPVSSNYENSLALYTLKNSLPGVDFFLISSSFFFCFSSSFYFLSRILASLSFKRTSLSSYFQIAS